ncbi:MAG: DUF6125 family protein [Candidatus Jordarchaeales archaeon]
MSGRELKWERLFNPRSVAVIGASNTPGKIGMILFSTIVTGGFKGDVYPVNPSTESVLGFKAYHSIKQVPGDVDLAIVAVPAKSVVNSVRECAEKGVNWCVVITAGFREIGGEGERMQEELVKICNESGMSLVGPNCMGVYSASSNLHALMNPFFPRKGSVSIVSQSGTVGMMLMDSLSQRGSGVARFVSSGNEAQVRLEDYLEFFAHDPETKVVAVFMEGVRDGRRFMEVARKVAEKKPLICLKGGRTRAGARAARSHTASVAGSLQVFKGVAKQTGIILASDCEELIDLAVAFSLSPLPEGRRIGVVTGGGGWGVLAADACEEHGLELVQLPESVVKKISARAPYYWSRGNPVDLAASMDMELYAWCYDLLLGEGGVDMLIVESMAYDVSGGVRRIVGSEEGAEAFMNSLRRNMVDHVAGVVKKHSKPVFVVARDEKLLKMMAEAGVPVFTSPTRAARCLAKMVEYREFRRRVEAYSGRGSVDAGVGGGRSSVEYIPPERVAEFFRGAYAAIDGVWFMSVEEKYGLSEAAELDARVWRLFARILAKRIMREFDVKGDGLDALVKSISLRWRMEKWVFETHSLSEREAVMRVYVCPWLEAVVKSGRRHVIPAMCGEVCEAVYRSWAETVNPKIVLERTRRMGCGDEFCEFKYSLEGE